MSDATKVLQIISIFQRSHFSVPVWLQNSISRQERVVIALKMHASTADGAETPSVRQPTIPSTDAYSSDILYWNQLRVINLQCILWWNTSLYRVRVIISNLLWSQSIQDWNLFFLGLWRWYGLPVPGPLRQGLVVREGSISDLHVDTRPIWARLNA